MSNELLFALIAFVDLFVILLAWKRGRRWLELFIIMNYVFAFLFVQKFSIVFGYEVTVGSVFYAAIFLGTDIITEHFGKKAGYELIWKCFAVILALLCAQQAVLLLGHTASSEEASGAMDILFNASGRILLVGLINFVIIQRTDIWIYHWIYKKTKGAKLWLRNIVSTTISQFLDSILFFGLAFYGTIPNNVLVSIMLTAFIMKFMIALVDTPFIYLSYWVKGKKVSDARKNPVGDI